MDGLRRFRLGPPRRYPLDTSFPRKRESRNAWPIVVLSVAVPSGFPLTREGRLRIHH